MQFIWRDSVYQVLLVWPSITYFSHVKQKSSLLKYVYCVRCQHNSLWTKKELVYWEWELEPDTEAITTHSSPRFYTLLAELGVSLTNLWDEKIRHCSLFIYILLFGRAPVCSQINTHWVLFLLMNSWIYLGLFLANVS